jgi:hypothetical protein
MRMTSTMTTMRTARSDTVPIALLAAGALSAGSANLLMNAPPSRLALTLIGVCAYAALARLSDYDTHLLCDTVQSGEAAVATLTLYAAALLVTTNPFLLMVLVVMALIPYQLFINLVLAPVKKEIALSGGAVQAILAVIAILIVTGGERAFIPRAGTVFTGYFSEAGVPAALPAASLAVALIIPGVLKTLNPEMMLLSQGSRFSRRPPWARTGARAGLVIARSLLAAISFLFAGWTCGIGISMRHLHRGALPDAVMILALVCLGQFAILIEVLSGPLPAAAASWACSYAVFSLYYYRKVHVYDRYQQS